MFNAEILWKLFIETLIKDGNELLVLETIQNAINTGTDQGYNRPFYEE